VELERGLRGTRGRCRQARERGKKEQKEARVLLESGGGRVHLYTWCRASLADEVGSEAIPDTAGGEGGSRGR